MRNHDRLCRLQQEILEQPDADSAALLAIFEARLRLARGTYGVCTSCGLKIDEETLDASPVATVCAVCAIFAAA